MESTALHSPDRCTLRQGLGAKEYFVWVCLHTVHVSVSQYVSEYCRLCVCILLTVVNCAFSPQTLKPHFHCGHSAPAAGTRDQNTWSCYPNSLSLHYLSVELSLSVAALSQQPPALYSHCSTHSHLRAATVQPTNQPTTGLCCPTLSCSTSCSAHTEARFSTLLHWLDSDLLYIFTFRDI